MVPSQSSNSSLHTFEMKRWPACQIMPTNSSYLGKPRERRCCNPTFPRGGGRLVLFQRLSVATNSPRGTRQLRFHFHRDSTRSRNGALWCHWDCLAGQPPRCKWPKHFHDFLIRETGLPLPLLLVGSNTLSEQRYLYASLCALRQRHHSSTIAKQHSKSRITWSTHRHDASFHP